MDFKGPCHEPGPTVGGTLSIHNLIHVGFVVHEMAMGLFCQSVLFHRHYKLNLILTLRFPGGQVDETLGSFKRSTVKCQQFEMKRTGVAGITEKIELLWLKNLEIIIIIIIIIIYCNSAVTR